MALGLDLVYSASKPEKWRETLFAVKPKSQIIIKDSPDSLAREAAEIFVAMARESVAHRDHFSVAISGGSTPRHMHKMLAEDPYLSEMPWYKTHIFWVDERCVPENDPASNYGAAKSDFIDRVPVPKVNIHPMPCRVSPEDGAIRYQRELIDFFQSGDDRFPVFDLIFLGIGTDGHTASLFPGQRALSRIISDSISTEEGLILNSKK